MYEWKRFFTWLRSGVCFTVTWFLFLILLLPDADGRIERASLWYLFAGAVGGVLLFCLFFTRVMLRKWGFTARFSLFMGLLLGWQMVFGGILLPDHVFALSPMQWLGFAGIAVLLYGISMVIYAVYRQKKGALYTQALQAYQSRTK